MTRRINAAIRAPIPKPRLQPRIRRWNKVGNWAIGIGIYLHLYVFGFWIDPELERHSLEEINRILSFAHLVLLLGIIIRTHRILPWLFIKIRRSK